jgi:Ribbon-Helix-Helix transcriptional regulator family
VARHILLDFRRILETAEGPSLYHPYRWWRTLAAGIHGLRDRAGETEKITINLDYVDLGHIDLLVRR